MIELTGIFTILILAHKSIRVRSGALGAVEVAFLGVRCRGGVQLREGGGRAKRQDAGGSGTPERMNLDDLAD